MNGGFLKIVTNIWNEHLPDAESRPCGRPTRLEINWVGREPPPWHTRSPSPLASVGLPCSQITSPSPVLCAEWARLVSYADAARRWPPGGVTPPPCPSCGLSHSGFLVGRPKRSWCGEAQVACWRGRGSPGQVSGERRCVVITVLPTNRHCSRPTGLHSPRLPLGLAEAAVLREEARSHRLPAISALL